MRTCAACGEPLPPSTGRGRPPAYCNVLCRRNAEYARKLARTPPRTSLDVWRARPWEEREAELARWRKDVKRRQKLNEKRRQERARG